MAMFFRSAITTTLILAGLLTISPVGATSFKIRKNSYVAFAVPVENILLLDLDKVKLLHTSNDQIKLTMFKHDVNAAYAFRAEPWQLVQLYPKDSLRHFWHYGHEVMKEPLPAMTVLVDGSGYDVQVQEVDVKRDYVIWTAKLVTVHGKNSLRSTRMEVGPAKIILDSYKQSYLSGK